MTDAICPNCGTWTSAHGGVVTCYECGNHGCWDCFPPLNWGEPILCRECMSEHAIRYALKKYDKAFRRLANG